MTTSEDAHPIAYPSRVLRYVDGFQVPRTHHVPGAGQLVVLKRAECLGRIEEVVMTGRLPPVVASVPSLMRYPGAAMAAAAEPSSSCLLAMRNPWWPSRDPRLWPRGIPRSSFFASLGQGPRAPPAGDPSLLLQPDAQGRPVRPRGLRRSARVPPSPSGMPRGSRGSTAGRCHPRSAVARGTEAALTPRSRRRSGSARPDWSRPAPPPPRTCRPWRRCSGTGCAAGTCRQQRVSSIVGASKPR